jgi:hypothetical protein
MAKSPAKKQKKSSDKYKSELKHVRDVQAFRKMGSTKVAPSKQLTGETTTEGPLYSVRDKRTNSLANKLRNKPQPDKKRIVYGEGISGTAEDVAEYYSMHDRAENDFKNRAARNKASADKKTAAGKASIKKLNSKGKKNG